MTVVGDDSANKPTNDSTDNILSRCGVIGDSSSPKSIESSDPDCDVTKQATVANRGLLIISPVLNAIDPSSSRTNAAVSPAASTHQQHASIPRHGIQFADRDPQTWDRRRLARRDTRRRTVSTGEGQVPLVHRYSLLCPVHSPSFTLTLPDILGLFCPFAHRANLVRHIKGLTDIITLSVVKPYPKGDDKGWPGWKFPKTNDEYTGATVDHLFGSEYLHEIYFKADKEYKGRYSVPVLWDKKEGTIVNNVCWVDPSEGWKKGRADRTNRRAPSCYDGYPQHSTAFSQPNLRISTSTPQISAPKSTQSPRGCSATSTQASTKPDSLPTSKRTTRT
jgi:Glutathione S-transferase, N-terminal domain